MHSIQSITANIQVDDIGDGYEVNSVLSDLLEREMEDELANLLDSKDNPDFATIYDRIEINIILEDVLECKSKIRNELLNQLDGILTKHSYSSEFPISEEITTERNYSNSMGDNSPDKARTIKVSGYFLENLLTFFRTGSSLSLTRYSHEELIEQIKRLLKEEVHGLVKKIADLVHFDKNALFRIINFFNKVQLKQLTVAYAKANGISNQSLNNYLDIIQQLFAEKKDFAEKVIILNTLITIHNLKLFNLDNELDVIHSLIVEYSEFCDNGPKNKKIILDELFLEHPDSLTSKLYSSITPYLIASQNFVQPDSLQESKILIHLIEEKKYQNKQHQNSKNASAITNEFSKDYINYLITTFEFLIRHNSYPYWFEKEENNKALFQDALGILFIKYKQEVRTRLQKFFDIIIDKTTILTILENNLSFETRLSLLHVLDEEVNYKLEVLQHLFVKSKGRLLNNKLLNEIIEDIIHKGFNYYKSEITSFLLHMILNKHDQLSVKQILTFFLLKISALKVEHKSLISPDMEILFGEFEPGWINIYTKIFQNNGSGSVESKSTSASMAEYPGISTHSDLKYFMSKFDYRKSNKIKKGENNQNDVRKYFESLATNPHFNIADPIRLVYLRNLSDKSEQNKMEWTYYTVASINFESDAKSDFKTEVTVINEQNSEQNYYIILALQIKKLKTELTNFRQLVEKIRVKRKVLDLLVNALSELFVQSFESIDEILVYLENFNLDNYISNNIITNSLNKFGTGFDLKRWHSGILDNILNITDENIKLRIILNEYTEIEETEKILRESQHDYLRSIIVNKTVALIENSSKTEEVYTYEVFKKLKEKFYEKVQKYSINVDTPTLEVLKQSLSVTSLQKLSESYNTKASFEANLKILIIQISREHHISIKILLASILNNYFKSNESLTQDNSENMLIYRLGFSLYELFIQSMSIAEQNIDLPSIAKEYVPERIIIQDNDQNLNNIVSNAGVVICGPYISMLFQRLDLLNDKKQIKDNYSINRAVFILNYLCYGELEVKEYHLGLNNILCNVPKNFIYDFSIKLTKKEKDTCNSLLENICQQWTALKSTSPDGLRYNFLIRDGSLSFDGAAHKLVVAKKPYDLLLSKIPWTIGTLKLPWMREFLFTEWA